MIHGDGQYDPKYIPSLLKLMSKDKKIGVQQVPECQGN